MSDETQSGLPRMPFETLKVLLETEKCHEPSDLEVERALAFELCTELRRQGLYVHLPRYVENELLTRRERVRQRLIAERTQV